MLDGVKYGGNNGVPPVYLTNHRNAFEKNQGIMNQGIICDDEAEEWENIFSIFDCKISTCRSISEVSKSWDALGCFPLSLAQAMQNMIPVFCLCLVTIKGTVGEGKGIELLQVREA